MKTIQIVFVFLLIAFLWIAYVVKTECFYIPYPNLIEYVLSLLLLLITGILLLWKKNRKGKVLMGVTTTLLFLFVINLLNYVLEWHPLNLAPPFTASQSFEVSHEPYAWHTAAPEKYGYNSEALENYFTKTRQWHTLRALLIIKDSSLIAEQYFAGTTPYSAFNVHSVTKSVTSALIGLAIQKHFIPSEEEYVMPYFPEYQTKKGNSPKNSLKLHHLLSMRGGWAGGDGPYSLEDCMLHEKIATQPGEEFKYYTGSQQILSAVLTKASGESTKGFAQKHLFEPLRIQPGFWRKQEGYYCGGDESYYTARDLARFGKLYLDHGKVGTVQVLDSVWISKSLNSYTDTSKAFRSGVQYDEIGYGYGWWKLKYREYAPMYCARGKGGQHLLLIPEKNIIIVVLQEWNLQRDKGLEAQMLSELLALVYDSDNTPLNLALKYFTICN